MSESVSKAKEKESQLYNAMTRTAYNCTENSETGCVSALANNEHSTRARASHSRAKTVREEVSKSQRNNPTDSRVYRLIIVFALVISSRNLIGNTHTP